MTAGTTMACLGSDLSAPKAVRLTRLSLPTPPSATSPQDKHWHWNGLTVTQTGDTKLDTLCVEVWKAL